MFAGLSRAHFDAAGCGHSLAWPYRIVVSHNNALASQKWTIRIRVATAGAGFNLCKHF
jgi:hypothetical protein